MIQDTFHHYSTAGTLFPVAVLYLGGQVWQSPTFHTSLIQPIIIFIKLSFTNPCYQRF